MRVTRGLQTNTRREWSVKADDGTPERPARIQDALMGHAVREVAYGEGATLAHRARWMARVWE